MDFVKEFPAVLVDLQLGTILEEFHSYVRPTEAPQLSEFCIHFTGITQSQVDQSNQLQEVLQRFDSWLKRTVAKHQLVLPKMRISSKPENTVFVTWSDWDFGVCLMQECTKKRLTRPGYFNQWMDLRKLYRVRLIMYAQRMFNVNFQTGFKLGLVQKQGEKLL